MRKDDPANEQLSRQLANRCPGITDRNSASRTTLWRLADRFSDWLYWRSLLHLDARLPAHPQSPLRLRASTRHLQHPLFPRARYGPKHARDFLSHCLGVRAFGCRSRFVAAEAVGLLDDDHR